MFQMLVKSTDSRPPNPIPNHNIQGHGLKNCIENVLQKILSRNQIEKDSTNES